jgi:SpoVK/Ycf46/Vps4 family AAA+-type ATPase
MEFREQLKLHVEAGYPLLYLLTTEEERAEREIEAAARAATPPRGVRAWDFVEGYVGSGGARSDPMAALDEIIRAPAQQATLFVLRDFDDYLSDPGVVRKLRNTMRTLRTCPKTIVILSPNLTVPKKLTQDAQVLDFTHPTYEDIKAEMGSVLGSSRMEEGSKETLIKACQGLTLTNIAQALRKAKVRYGKALDDRAIDEVLEEKKQIVRRTEVLEFYTATETLNDIGGLDLLKEWLRERSLGFSDRAKKAGLTSPKGVLLCGIAGTGKSLAAKAIARLWRQPLLRLDVGRLFTGIVGGSEAIVRDMIQMATAMAPCILWVDEIEKGFAGLGASGQLDSGVTARVFGTFLTWMQEKTAPVFIAATANNLRTLAQSCPELLRKGRFDEIFFVDLPTARERQEIFEVHLAKKTPVPLSGFDLPLLAGHTHDFSGAEIEQAIMDAQFRAFAQNRDVSTGDVLACAACTVPLAQMAREQIAELRWFLRQGRARPASSEATTPVAAAPQSQVTGGLLEKYLGEG